MSISSQCQGALPAMHSVSPRSTWIVGELLFRGESSVTCRKRPRLTTSFLSLNQYTLDEIQDTMALYQILASAIEDSTYLGVSL